MSHAEPEHNRPEEGEEAFPFDPPYRIDNPTTSSSAKATADRGEWTVAEVLDTGCVEAKGKRLHCAQCAFLIAQKHNAALADEREKYRQEAVALEQMAGRYNRDVKQLHDQLDIEYDKAQRQLADEREKLGWKARAKMEKQLKDLEHKLAVEQSVVRHLDQQLAASREKVQTLRDALNWLDQFVVEPEYYPADGDRYWWQEKRASIAALAKTKN